MNDHCPDCGATFEEPRDLRHWWLRLLRCPKDHAFFMEIADARWTSFLQRLDTGVGQKLCDAPNQVVELAASRIKRIDHKTVSTVFFEHTLLGCYDPAREYEVGYKQ
jgi:hypothetical protein